MSTKLPRFLSRILRERAQPSRIQMKANRETELFRGRVAEDALKTVYYETGTAAYKNYNSAFDGGDGWLFKTGTL